MDAEPRDLPAWKQDKDYQHLINLLADDKSRRIIERIISFRFGSDLSFSAYKSEEQQYFNHLTLQALPTDRPISYLDVGAYDGDTLRNLCNKTSVGTAICSSPIHSTLASWLKLRTSLFTLILYCNQSRCPLGQVANMDTLVYPLMVKHLACTPMISLLLVMPVTSR